MSLDQQPSIEDRASASGKLPDTYLIQKASACRLVLLGTRHKHERIHRLITDALPGLVEQAGVNTLFVEVPSNEQASLDQFRMGLRPVSDIRMWDIIDCEEYQSMISRARELRMDIVAIDNDEDPSITRDQWMANKVLDYIDRHPQTRGVVVVGNRHVLKDVKWQEGCAPSLADYLVQAKPFSIVMWPGHVPARAPVGLDVDPACFLGVKDPTLNSMNTHTTTSLATSTDGVIFLPE